MTWREYQAEVQVSVFWTRYLCWCFPGRVSIWCVVLVSLKGKGPIYRTCGLWLPSYVVFILSVLCPPQEGRAVYWRQRAQSSGLARTSVAAFACLLSSMGYLDIKPLLVRWVITRTSSSYLPTVPDRSCFFFTLTTFYIVENIIFDTLDSF